jgi:hypothetical protein
MRKSTFKILAAIFGIFALMFVSAIVAIYLTHRNIAIDAGRSNEGYSVRIDVSDRGLGWGRDYYTDVVMLNSAGVEVARWEDDDGRQYSEGVSDMRETMVWLDGNTVTFSPENRGKITLAAGKKATEIFQEDEIKPNKSKIATPSKRFD